MRSPSTTSFELEDATMLQKDNDDEDDLEASPLYPDALPHAHRHHAWSDRRRGHHEDFFVKRKPRSWLLWLRRILYIPLFLLAFFGAVHLVHVLYSSDNLFLPDSSFDDHPFWPEWGTSDHLGAAIAHYPTDITRDVIPIPCHSHNDYWRNIPLYEALHYGCTGVEADVWLKHDELYVGHSTSSLTRNRTFTAMYVDPLVSLLERMNPTTEFTNTSSSPATSPAADDSPFPRGVFDEDPKQTLVLLVDFKTDGRALWPKVVSQLNPLRNGGYLSSWNGDVTTYRAITVVATGNAPFDMLVANDTYRDIFFDAPLDRLVPASDSPNLDGSSGSGSDSNGEEGQGKVGVNGTTATTFDQSNSFYASTSLFEAVGPLYRGKFSPVQLEIMRLQIAAAERQGLKSRYWETPSWPISTRNHVWRTLVDEGVRVLNVDDLRAAARVDWRRKGHGII